MDILWLTSQRVFTFQPNDRLAGHLGDLEPLMAGPHFVVVNDENEIVVTGFHNHSLEMYSVSSSSSSLVSMARAVGSCGLQWEHPVADLGNSHI